ncbi:hypothetical protein GPEL0_01f0157 [Geoanaerobacter pelophilus]|uniref:Uncharacterized protein n=1 Tax=Geoanaerobacter pelophilus TaxID=60036 RepID=A0ABQ0MDY7_9BACT|nr:hypothetical protein GPEL0_01f0157 [Geoanaerobacter pelophilus]
MVKAEDLQELIEQAGIVSFLRSDGECVQIGTDAVRGMGGEELPRSGAQRQRPFLLIVQL